MLCMRMKLSASMTKMDGSETFLISRGREETMDVVITMMVQTISYVKSFSEHILYVSIQVYLVTGGYFSDIDNHNNMIFLDSTEVLIKDAISWNVIKNPLPQPMAKMGIISFQNKIFMIGIFIDNLHQHIEIWIRFVSSHELSSLQPVRLVTIISPFHVKS